MNSRGILDLDEVDAATWSAQGPLFNLDRVFTAGQSIFLALAEIAAVVFPGLPAPFSNLLDAPLYLFWEECRRAALTHNVSDIHLTRVIGGRYLVIWTPLGAALYGGSKKNLKQCMTCFGEDWNRLHVPPIIQIKPLPLSSVLRAGMRSGINETELLLARLKGCPVLQQIQATDRYGPENLVFRFRHDVCGAGRGELRILRRPPLSTPVVTVSARSMPPSWVCRPVNY